VDQTESHARAPQEIQERVLATQRFAKHKCLFFNGYLRRVHPRARECAGPLLDRFSLGFECAPAVVIHQPEPAPRLRKAKVCIVLTQLQPILGPAREHPVGLGNAASDQVVDQYTQVGLVAPRTPSWRPTGAQRSVDPRKEALRINGLALAAAEKCVQMIYEHQQRPPEKRHEPWLQRVESQANAGFVELEKAMQPGRWLQGDRMGAADVVTACVWRFAQFYVKETGVKAARYPKLAAHSALAEALPEFTSTPLD